ncbi:MAG: hypothetical protein REI94_04765 [Moraxellaceae bacterium]|nr:hypothetical protein [Moraxellaceae bacterium]
MAADMWRVPSSKVVKSGRFCFVEDKGMLRKASSAGNGNFLFSEVGAGVEPLALVGMYHEVQHFLERYARYAIENRIGSLPDIYMGVAYYIPGKRYKVLDPVGETAVALAKGLADFVPGNAITDVAGAGSTIFEQLRSMFGGKKKKPKHSIASTPLYIKFTYLEEKGMDKIGSGQVTMEAIKLALKRYLPQIS